MDLQTFLNDFMNKDDLDLLVRDAAGLFECPAMVVDMAFHVIAWHCEADFDDTLFQTSVQRGSLTYEAGSLLGQPDLRGGQPAGGCGQPGPAGQPGGQPL